MCTCVRTHTHIQTSRERERDNLHLLFHSSNVYASQQVMDGSSLNQQPGTTFSFPLWMAGFKYLSHFLLESFSDSNTE